ncbi:MAG: 16S rRNA (cytosine(1402)-N(4))-methyltransferase RsmH [Corallococcus sp.]|nr:16S rRNA (cytosine(1402)-N(4))-methyltransferase RsmH [Corallococcus sp.]MCM1359284.1 16S rRNA (cytosine(1402)-N(4))-methyltransferase RsmH [Corallococcus sp.]MCM1394676.1 16S rRNA (cytosine(1402)-N(4))-methyltransferase RsmH [Corallococcus sp.]
MIFAHKSVMLDECVQGLNVKPNGIYVDCTCGGGGHSQEILKRLDGGKLICVDKDEEALHVCKNRLSQFGNVEFVHSDFKNLKYVLNQCGVDKVDGFLADLGVSSYQIDNPERGFSYMAKDAPLDMRMDVSVAFSAKDVVNVYTERQLFSVIRDYGEENFAKNIAKNIVLSRQEKAIETCGQLVEIIDRSIPYACKNKGGHTAKRTFQALRIEVNKELTGLDNALKEMCTALFDKGRIAVITFHSLEDRIVKHTFNDLSTGCVCPPNLPVCVCGHKSQGRTITKKPILPSKEELSTNTRSQSAKLRVFEKA